ncbi:MAG: hypothetical protein Q9214_000167 [Letrouitia sp. 1 TL-2023]
MSTGPPYSVSQTTANCCPSLRVIIVPLIPGQFCKLRVGLVEGDVVVEETLAMVVLLVTIVGPLEEYVLVFRGDDVVVFKLIVGRPLADVLMFEYDDKEPETKEVMFKDVVIIGNPVLATTGRVVLKDEGRMPVTNENEELKFSEFVGNPDVGRTGKLEFSEIVGKPDVGRIGKLEFSEIVGKPDVGRVGELEFSETEGMPELTGLEELTLADEGGMLELTEPVIDVADVELKGLVGDRLAIDELAIAVLEGGMAEEGRVTTIEDDAL